MRRDSTLRYILVLLLAVSLLCTACAGNKSSSMQSVKTEGNVGIGNGDGEEVSDGPGTMIDQAATELERIMGSVAADTVLGSRVNDTLRQEEKNSLYGNSPAVDEDAALEWQESLVDNLLNGREALPDWMEPYERALMPGDAAESAPEDYAQIRMGSDVNCY